MTPKAQRDQLKRTLRNLERDAAGAGVELFQYGMLAQAGTMLLLSEAFDGMATNLPAGPQNKPTKTKRVYANCANLHELTSTKQPGLISGNSRNSRKTSPKNTL